MVLATTKERSNVTTELHQSRKQVYTTFIGNATRYSVRKMLNHLLNFEPDILPAAQAPLAASKASPIEELNAKINTNEWLKKMGAPDSDTTVSELEKQQARQTFTALTSAAPIKTQKDLVAKLETPAAVRHLTGMLTAYDWEFVTQAKELRGYAVAKILEECESTNASIRLKALGLLGKVTEVGLFTEKIEVKQEKLSDSDLDSRIKEKLNKFMGVVDVVDIYTSANPDTPDDSV